MKATAAAAKPSKDPSRVESGPSALPENTVLGYSNQLLSPRYLLLSPRWSRSELVYAKDHWDAFSGSSSRSEVAKQNKKGPTKAAINPTGPQGVAPSLDVLLLDATVANGDVGAPFFHLRRAFGSVAAGGGAAATAWEETRRLDVAGEPPPRFSAVEGAGADGCLWHLRLQPEWPLRSLRFRLVSGCAGSTGHIEEESDVFEFTEEHMQDAANTFFVIVRIDDGAGCSGRFSPEDARGAEEAIRLQPPAAQIYHSTLCWLWSAKAREEKTVGWFLRCHSHLLTLLTTRDHGDHAIRTLSLSECSAGICRFFAAAGTSAVGGPPPLLLHHVFATQLLEHYARLFPQHLLPYDAEAHARESWTMEQRQRLIAASRTVVGVEGATYLTASLRGKIANAMQQLIRDELTDRVVPDYELVLALCRVLLEFGAIEVAATNEGAGTSGSFATTCQPAVADFLGSLRDTVFDRENEKRPLPDFKKFLKEIASQNQQNQSQQNQSASALSLTPAERENHARKLQEIQGSERGFGLQHTVGDDSRLPRSESLILREESLQTAIQNAVQLAQRFEFARFSVEQEKKHVLAQLLLALGSTSSTSADADEASVEINNRAGEQGRKRTIPLSVERRMETLAALDSFRNAVLHLEETGLFWSLKQLTRRGDDLRARVQALVARYGDLSSAAPSGVQAQDAKNHQLPCSSDEDDAGEEEDVAPWSVATWIGFHDPGAGGRAPPAGVDGVGYDVRRSRYVATCNPASSMQPFGDRKADAQKMKSFVLENEALLGPLLPQGGIEGSKNFLAGEASSSFQGNYMTAAGSSTATGAAAHQTRVEKQLRVAVELVANSVHAPEYVFTEARSSTIRVLSTGGVCGQSALRTIGGAYGAGFVDGPLQIPPDTNALGIPHQHVPARFRQPQDILRVDDVKNSFLVADTGNNALRLIEAEPVKNVVLRYPGLPWGHPHKNAEDKIFCARTVTARENAYVEDVREDGGVRIPNFSPNAGSLLAPALGHRRFTQPCCLLKVMQPGGGVSPGDYARAAGSGDAAAVLGRGRARFLVGCANGLHAIEGSLQPQVPVRKLYPPSVDVPTGATAASFSVVALAAFPPLNIGWNFWRQRDKRSLTPGTASSDLQHAEDKDAAERTKSRACYAANLSLGVLLLTRDGKIQKYIFDGDRVKPVPLRLLSELGPTSMCFVADKSARKVYLVVSSGQSHTIGRAEWDLGTNTIVADTEEILFAGQLHRSGWRDGKLALLREPKRLCFSPPPALGHEMVQAWKRELRRLLDEAAHLSRANVAGKKEIKGSAIDPLAVSDAVVASALVEGVGQLFVLEVDRIRAVLLPNTLRVAGRAYASLRRPIEDTTAGITDIVRSSTVLSAQRMSEAILGSRRSLRALVAEGKEESWRKALLGTASSASPPSSSSATRPAASENDFRILIHLAPRDEDLVPLLQGRFDLDKEDDLLVEDRELAKRDLLDRMRRRRVDSFGPWIEVSRCIGTGLLQFDADFWSTLFRHSRAPPTGKLIDFLERQAKKFRGDAAAVGVEAPASKKPLGTPFDIFLQKMNTLGVWLCNMDQAATAFSAQPILGIIDVWARSGVFHLREHEDASQTFFRAALQQFFKMPSSVAELRRLLHVVGKGYYAELGRRGVSELDFAKHLAFLFQSVARHEIPSTGEKIDLLRELLFEGKADSEVSSARAARPRMAARDARILYMGVAAQIAVHNEMHARGSAIGVDAEEKVKDTFSPGIRDEQWAARWKGVSWLHTLLEFFAAESKARKQTPTSELALNEDLWQQIAQFCKQVNEDAKLGLARLRSQAGAAATVHELKSAVHAGIFTKPVCKLLLTPDLPERARECMAEQCQLRLQMQVLETVQTSFFEHRSFLAEKLSRLGENWDKLTLGELRRILGSTKAEGSGFFGGNLQKEEVVPFSKKFLAYTPWLEKQHRFRILAELVTDAGLRLRVHREEPSRDEGVKDAVVTPSPPPGGAGIRSESADAAVAETKLVVSTSTRVLVFSEDAEGASASTDEGVLEQDIERAAETLQALQLEFEENRVSFPVLEQLLPFFREGFSVSPLRLGTALEDEFAAFCRRVNFTRTEDDATAAGGLVLPLPVPSNALKRHVMGIMERFTLLKIVHGNLAGIEEFFREISFFIAKAELPSWDARVAAALAALREAVTTQLEPRWRELDSGCIDEILQRVVESESEEDAGAKTKAKEGAASADSKFSVVDVRILSVDIEALQGIKKHLPVLRWLAAAFESDEDFVAATQMAMGKSEMECPPELWVDDVDGKHGRVNEEILSELTTLRRSLARYLYGGSFPDNLKSLGEALHYFSELASLNGSANSSGASYFCSLLTSVSAVYLPLSELLSSETESSGAAPARLMNLYKWSAAWVADRFGEISLQYVPKKRKAGNTSSSRTQSAASVDPGWAAQTQEHQAGAPVEGEPDVAVASQGLQEILDFQTSLVLARQVDAEVSALITKFVGQFRWVKELSQTVARLGSIGHVSYGRAAADEETDEGKAGALPGAAKRMCTTSSSIEFRYAFSESDVPMIQEEVTRLRREADNWVLAVNELRRQYPLLNDYTMHQLQRELARFTPAPLARSVSGLNTTAVGLLKQLAEAWTTRKQRESTLRPLAASSNYTGDQTTGGKTPPLGGYGASFPPGLSLVVGDPLEQCVVAFAKAGFLPEWTHVLVYVDAVTTWEEVQIFLYRWALQHQSKTKAADGEEVVPTCPFCVCGVDYLRGEWYFQLQQEIQKLSDEHEATHGAKPPPLLLISSTPDHVAAKLHAHLRLELRAETRIFQSVKRSLGYFEDEHEETTTAVGTTTCSANSMSAVICSGGSGGGKSAFARRRARGKRYVYLPLYANSDVATREGVIRYLKRETSPDAATREATFLHVDVLDSFVSPVVEDLLFHLIVLQRLCVRDLLWERPRKNVVFDIFVELPNSGWVKKSAFLRSAVGRFDVAPGDVFSCDWSPLTVGATDADPGSGLAPVAERDSQRASLGTGGAAADLAQASYNNNERRDCILRLKVVCLCLKAREDNLGGFPADWKKDLLQLSQKLMPLLRSDPQGRKSAQGANMGYSDAILTELFTASGYADALRQMKEPNPTAAAHADFSAALALDSKDCLSLLLRAAQVTSIDRNNAAAAASCDWRVSGSLWSLWSFVHLLYDGLCRLASHESERGTFSNMVGGRTGEQLRGQVIGFLCRTAAEVAFARRRNNAAPAGNGNANPDVQELTEADRAPWLRFSVSANSWLYERCQFDHELKPVYRMGSLMDPSYVYASHEFPPTLVPDVGMAPTPTGAERSENAEPQLAEEHYYWLLGGGDISRLGNRVDYLSTDSNLEVASAWRTAEEVKRGVAASMSAFSVRLCAEPQANAGAGPVLRHAPRRDEDERLLEELFSTGDLLPWSASNHEMLLTAEREVFFLASNSLELRKRMHPRLVELLDRADVPVGNDLQKLTSNKTGILTRMLAALTNVTEPDSVKPLPAPLRNFMLTGDVVLKLLAIYLRVRNQIPVILLGECGCGKTHMLRYLCAWLGVGLVVEDVHGGTTENDIASAVRRAEALLARTSRTAQTRPVASTDTGTPDHDEVDHGGSDGEEVFKAVYLFFDEMNTCAHMGLIAEVIMHRSMKGRSIDPRIQILAACNPYRKYPPNAAMLQRSAGMEFGAQSGTCSKSTENPRNKSGDPANIPRDLVYRVHPIPTCLKQFVFDFGALSDVSELQFITSMVRSEYPQPVSDPAATQVLIGWLEVAQRYVREVEGDVSVVSLRDVARCLKLCKWFAKYAGTAGGRGAVGSIKPKTNASSAASQQRRGTFEVLAVAHVYYFRLPAEERAELLSRLRLRLGLALTRAKEKDGEDNELEKNWKWLFPPNVMAKVIAKTAKSLASKFELEPGIALNDALTENLYVSFVAICNKIPIFIVGKPGSSKTLTLQILTSNLRGEQSSGSYWRKFPSIYVFPYQCSPFSTAAGILQQFRIAVNYSRKAKRAMTCLLLDEIGLAEHSPDLPLKVLHGILISPPIAIVGLSNWALDAAKMNRAILLNRTDPKADDVELTGSCIVAAGSTATTPAVSSEDGGKSTGGAPCGSSSTTMPSHNTSAELSTWLIAISQAYSKIYAEQEGRNFVGMRDYYQMLKLIRRLFLQLKASVDAAYVDVKDETPVTKTFATSERRSNYAHSNAGDPVTERLLQGELARIRDEHADVLKIEKTREGFNFLSWPLVAFALQRNFNGRPGLLQSVYDAFDSNLRNCTPALTPTRQTGTTTSREPFDFSTLQLIESNLCDPDARHLMLLTDVQGSALEILFQTKLLRRGETEVLMGSPFSDDKNELSLIQHVNRVKEAMATGKTVVLWNLDTVYESLYDVLNQRFVVRRNKAASSGAVVGAAEDGAGGGGMESRAASVTKMLRIAIGPRSQLCPVHADGFRIVTIVERTHAYEKLDLPLLNRFEKQTLGYRDVVDEAAFTRAKAYVAEVAAAMPAGSSAGSRREERNRGPAPFVGIDDEGLASLLVQVAGDCEADELWGNEYGEDRDQVKKIAEDTTAFDAVWQKKLLRLALPLAVSRSEVLRRLLPRDADAFSQFSDFASLCSTNADGTSRFSSVFTHTPMMPLELVLSHQSRSSTEDERTQRTPPRFQCLRLSEIASQVQLVALCERFWSAGNEQEVLFVQCDGRSSERVVIEHAKRLVVQSWVDHGRHIESTRSSTAKKRVVFVIHAQPGQHMLLSGTNHVVFNDTWRNHFFIDDIRPNAAFVLREIPLRVAVDESLWEVFTAREELLRSILRAKSRQMLIRHPSTSSSRRIHETRSDADLPGQETAAFSWWPALEQFFSELTLRVLRAQHDSEGRSAEIDADNTGDERAKTPRQHVSWAIGELSTGSLKVSLEVVIESYLLQILSHWGQFLDVNFALRLVGKGGREGGVDVTPHFFTAMCRRFLDIESLAARFRFETTFAADVREVANTGSLQPFMCRVPFSHKLLPVLEHAVELVRCDDRTSGADAARNGEPVLEFGQTKPEIASVDDARLLEEYDWVGAGATGFPPELQDDDEDSGNTVTAEGAAARGSDNPEEWADEVWLANYFGKDRELAKWLCSAPVVDAYLDDFVQQKMAQYPNVSHETQFRLVKQAICGSSQENGWQSCLRSPLDVHRRHTKERFLIQKKLALLSYFSFDDETTATFHYESLVLALTSVVTRQVDELLQSSVLAGASAREAYFLKLANFGQDLRDFDDRSGLWIATAARFFLVLQDEASGGREDGARTTGARAVFSNHMRQYIRGAGGNDESPVSRRTAESFLAMVVAAGTEDSAHFRLLVNDLFLDAGTEFFMSSRESSSADQGNRGKRECDVLFGTLLAGRENLKLPPLPPRVQRLVAWRLGPQGMAEYEGRGDVRRHCLLWLNVVQDRDEARLPASIDALTEDVLRVNEGVPETAGLRGKLWGGSAAASIRMALWARKYVPQLAKYLLQAVKVGLANCIAGSSELGDADDVPNSGADVAIHSALNILRMEQSSQAASASKAAAPLHTTHEAFAAAVYEKIQIPSGIFPLIRSSEHVRLFFLQCLHRFGAFEGICEVFSCMPPTVIKELGYVKDVDFASLERAANLFTAEMYQDFGALMLHRSAELPAGIAVDAHGRTAEGAVPAQDSCEQKQAYREAFKLSARNDFALRTCFCEGGQIENGAEQQSGRLLCFEEVCASFAFSARVSGCLFPATKEQEHDRLRGRLFDEKVVRQALRAVERNPATAGKIGERERIFASEKVEASGVTFLSPACKSDSDSSRRSGELLYLWLYRVFGPHFKHHRSAFFLQPAGRRDDGPAVAVATGSSSPTTTTILPNLPGAFPAKISLASFAFHFLKLITRHPDSFYYSLLTQPEACRSSFLPGCPGSEMALVIRGLQEQVTWYRCPNGHLYTVGNCGMPMQQSRCSQCGAAIGGHDHRPTGQQTRLGRATEVGAALETPGYVLDLKDPRVSPAADVVQQRLFTVRAVRPGSQDAAAINLHRLLLHLALLLSCEVFGDERHVEMLVRSGTARGGNNGATLKGRILGHITHSWEACRRELNTRMHSALSDQEFSLFLHVLLLKLDPVVERSRAFFPEMAAMLRFEEAVAHVVLELRANWGVEAKKARRIACGGEQEAEAGKSAVLFETAVRQAFGDDVVAKLVATEQLPAAATVNAAAAPRGNVAPSRWSLAERFDPPARSSTSTSTDSSVSSILPVLLQLREPMSLERFLAQIIPAASPNFLGEKCQFLMRFLRLESRLHLCKFAADILDWTQVLCGDYDGRAGDGSGGPNATLARRGLLGHQKSADGSAFTLQPEEDHDAASSNARSGRFSAGASHLISRDEAYRTPMRASASTPARQLKLCRFLRAFNEGLPWLQTLHECQRNPFLATDADGNPTVSIDGEKLQPDSPIVFGLPSQPPQTRAVDPSGLCVLRLLDFFGRTNNELLEELASLDEGGSSRLFDRGGQTTRTGFGDGASMIDTRSVLELHLETPCDDARRRLIHYDRADDLLPLLHEFFGEETEQTDASKAEEGIHGLLLAFQSAVKRRVIFRKNISRVQVLVRQFLYRGELRARGSLGVLGRVVAQSGVLPFTVHKRLEDDVNNCRERHRQLTALVERVIQSLVVFGLGAAASGETPLRDYLREALPGGGASPWPEDEGHDMAILGDVQLRHLGALYLALETIGSGGADSRFLPQVPDRYRQPVPAEIVERLHAPFRGGRGWNPDSGSPGRRDANLPEAPSSAPLSSPKGASARAAVLARPSGSSGFPFSRSPEEAAEMDEEPAAPRGIKATTTRQSLQQVLRDRYQGVLRDLLCGPLSDPETQYDGGESLKLFLEYADTDLERDSTFRDHFPDALALSHSLELLRMLCGGR